MFESTANCCWFGNSAFSGYVAIAADGRRSKPENDEDEVGATRQAMAAHWLLGLGLVTQLGDGEFIESDSFGGAA